MLVATLYPRLALLGGLPYTDEGIYAFWSQIIHASIAAGRGLPDHGVLNLYPALLAWVFAFDWNHLLVLRVADMLVAVWAGWLLYRVAAHESGSAMAGAVIAAIFAFAMNQYVFVQLGYKNSFFAAYVPLLFAARLGLDRDRSDTWRWHACGALVALAVLLRETFVPFAALGAVAILVAHGWAHCLRYVGAGVVTGGVLLGLMMLWRGSVGGLLGAYSENADFYAALTPLWEGYFPRAIESTWREARFLAPIVAAAVLVIVVAMARGQRSALGRVFFWLAAAAVPLLEVATKVGFAYHVAVSFLGLCGLCALGWKLSEGLARRSRWTLGVVALVPAFILAWPQLGALNGHFRARAVHDVSEFARVSWPQEAVARSNYLLLAEAIRKAAPPGSTPTLSSSAITLIPYPLTGLRPPAYGLEDLSEVALRVRMDVPAVRAAIRECPPDLIVVATRTDLPGRGAVVEAVAGMPEYVEAAHVAIDKTKNYGIFGASIYRRETASGCRRTP